MSKVLLDLQIACNTTNNIPTEADFLRWLQGVLPLFRNFSEITIRLVEEPEIHKLNYTYRKEDRPTNVLSFPFELSQKFELPLLGDLIICIPILAREAQQQEKMLGAHCAHMVVHGSLHLLGYDHLLNDKALEMELLETEIIQKLGYPDPYRAEKT